MNPGGITTSRVHAALEREPRVNDVINALEVLPAYVTLEGSVPNEHQKRRAELDAWSLFAIRGVVNKLQVAR